MESRIRATLGCEEVAPYGRAGGGCISTGQGFTTDTHGNIFVKFNEKDGVS
jgi:hypothetical protein